MQDPSAAQQEGKGSRIQDAVTAELSGDYQSAFKVYEDLVIQADSGDVSFTAAEYFNWENGRLRCLGLLQKWQPLLEAVISEVVGSGSVRACVRACVIIENSSLDSRCTRTYTALI